MLNLALALCNLTIFSQAPCAVTTKIIMNLFLYPGEQKKGDKEKDSLVKEKEKLEKENKELKTKLDMELKDKQKKHETELKKVRDECNRKICDTEKELKDVKNRLQERETVFRDVDSKI